MNCNDLVVLKATYSSLRQTSNIVSQRQFMHIENDSIHIRIHGHVYVDGCTHTCARACARIYYILYIEENNIL